MPRADWIESNQDCFILISLLPVGNPVHTQVITGILFCLKYMYVNIHANDMYIHIDGYIMICMYIYIYIDSPCR